MHEVATKSSQSQACIFTVEPQKYSHQNHVPCNKMNHIMAYHNDQIFIIGGTAASNNCQDQNYRVVYWFSFASRQWSRKEFAGLVKSEDKDREKEREKDEDSCYQANTRSHMAYCVADSKIYIFGGTNARNQCNNELLVFDTKKYEWENVKNDNPPEPRQAASMCHIPSQSIIVLYGGIDVLHCEIFDRFYCYSMATGVWRPIIEGNYHTIVRPRYLASMCNIDNKLYLFGGEYRTPDGAHNYLSDFYEFTVTAIPNPGTVSSRQQNTDSRSRGQCGYGIDCELIRGNERGYVLKSPKPKHQQKEKITRSSKDALIELEERQQANLQGVTRRREAARLKSASYVPPLEQNNQMDNAQSENTRKNSKNNANVLISGLEKSWPFPKSGHRLLALTNRHIILVGGSSSDQYFLSDAWVYSLDTSRWKKLQFDTTVPKQAGLDCCMVVHAIKKDKQSRQNAAQKRENRNRVRKEDRDEQFQGGDYDQSILYMFGGINSYESVKHDLFALRLDISLSCDKELPYIDRAIRSTSSEPKSRPNITRNLLDRLFYNQPRSSCSYCEFPQEAPYVSKQVIDSFLNIMALPFKGVGLLLQNCYNNGGSQFSIAHRNQVAGGGEPNKCDLNTMPSSKTSSVGLVPPFLHIVENNNIRGWSYAQLKSTIGNFQYFQYFTYHNMDKRVRTSLQKEHNFREYGVYLKMGALRLGDQFIYLVRGPKNQMRVFAFLLAINRQGDQSYQFCTYIYDLQLKKVVEETQEQLANKLHSYYLQFQPEITYKDSVNPYYTYSYEKITKKYGKYIEDVISKSEQADNNNHLLIFQLKKMPRTRMLQTLPQLYVFEQSTDICYRPYHKTLLTQNQTLSESIDISLSAFMSMYFLKSEVPKLSIKINGKEKKIASQMYLQAFDRMVRDKTTYEIDNSLVNVELKLMELYYNPNLSVPTPSFHNGVLLYHRGRLVSRYDCPIGQLYKKSNHTNFNFFHLFGLIEVPEAVLPNIFRTDFVYNVMIEKLRSRLKYLEGQLKLAFEKPGDYPILFKNLTTGANSDPDDKQPKVNKKSSIIKDKQKQRQRERERQREKQRQRLKQKQKELERRIAREQRLRQKKQDTEFTPNRRF